MKSIKVCEYSRSFHDDLILQDQASGERSQDQWSSGVACNINGVTYVTCENIKIVLIQINLKMQSSILCFIDKT